MLCYSEAGKKMGPFCKTVQSALLCGVNDLDGTENIVPAYVNDYVLG
jgi:hypothetical protein